MLAKIGVIIWEVCAVAAIIYAFVPSRVKGERCGHRRSS